MTYVNDKFHGGLIHENSITPARTPKDQRVRMKYNMAEFACLLYKCLLTLLHSPVQNMPIHLY